MVLPHRRSGKSPIWRDGGRANQRRPGGRSSNQRNEAAPAPNSPVSKNNAARHRRSYRELRALGGQAGTDCAGRFVAETPAHGRSGISLPESDVLPVGAAVAAGVPGAFARARGAGGGRSARRE